MKNLLWILLLCICSSGIPAQSKIPVIIDADTGNEVDDLYALARALIEPSWDILALNATHWQTAHWSIPKTMENSHRLNQVLTAELNTPVLLRRGAMARMFDWGDLAQHSAAAYEIIKQAKQMPEGQKLTVIALGALTNVASAIYIDPSITSKINLYWLGTTYDFEQGIQKQLDFNCMMDIRALDVVLQSDTEFHILPVSVASAMTFKYDETIAAFDESSTLQNFLLERWYNHLDTGRKKRTIWDLALIQWVIHPEMVEEVTIRTSKEHGDRAVFYCKSIDAEKMKEEFFKTLNDYLEQQKK